MRERLMRTTGQYYYFRLEKVDALARRMTHVDRYRVDAWRSREVQMEHHGIGPTYAKYTNVYSTYSTSRPRTSKTDDSR